jgi:hypothetical protein
MRRLVELVELVEPVASAILNCQGIKSPRSSKMDRSLLSRFTE